MIFDNDTSSSTAIYTFSTTADTTSTANAVTDIYILLPLIEIIYFNRYMQDIYFLDICVNTALVPGFQNFVINCINNSL